MIEIRPPQTFREHLHRPSVFLAGSIEMGKAEDWQARVVAGLETLDVTLLNPRRSAWDPSWEQSIDNPLFRGQVEWELDALDAADYIIVYFSPETKAPITLMELGIHAAKDPQKLLVCCPAGFWRKGNVDIVCARYGVQQVDTLDALIALASDNLRQLKRA